MSDISFTCEGSDKIFYAHKYVLGTSSVVFRAMFYGDLAEKNSVVHLSDTDENSFEEFLRFLYTDTCNLTTDNGMSLMYLGKKYLVSSLMDFFEKSITNVNTASMLECAVHFGDKKLEKACWNFIDCNMKNFIRSKYFNDVSQKTLASLLKLERTGISEVELFHAVLEWSKYQCAKKKMEPTRENKRSVIGNAIYDLRFFDMKQNEFATNVVASGLLTAEEIVPVYNQFNGMRSPDLKWKTSAEIRQDRRKLAGRSSNYRW